MANEVSQLWTPSDSLRPIEFFNGIVPAMSTTSHFGPSNPSVVWLVAVDIAIVAAITTGYFQLADSLTGASFFFDEMDSATNGSYASWRGLKLVEYPVRIDFENHTTSAAGVVATGYAQWGQDVPQNIPESSTPL
jgi:hypothetical protein